MTDILKQIGISVAVVVVALLLTGNFGGGAVGGTYEITKQYFAAGIDVTGSATADDVVAEDDLTVSDDVTFGSASASSSVNFGRACWEVTTNVGSTTYVSFIGTGSSVRIATSTTSCN